MNFMAHISVCVCVCVKCFGGVYEPVWIVNELIYLALPKRTTDLVAQMFYIHSAGAFARVALKISTRWNLYLGGTSFNVELFRREFAIANSVSTRTSAALDSDSLKRTDR